MNVATMVQALVGLLQAIAAHTYFILLHMKPHLQGRRPLQAVVCVTGLVGFHQRGRQTTS